MNKRVQRYVTLAIKESLNSTYRRVKIGAVIVDGNYVVSKGANLLSSHPMQFRYNNKVSRVAPDHNCHAEILALVRSKSYDLSGAEIFVGRLNRVGNLADCRPCSACFQAIVDSGITTITYTTPRGVFQEEVIR